MTRPFTCQQCEKEGKCGKYGPLRQYCDECRVSRHTDSARQHVERMTIEGRKRFRKKNPEYFYNHSLKRLYGITREDYDCMGEAQGWTCAICGEPPSGEGNGTRLVVDHCHKSGSVRALLCSPCNKGIGLLRDSADIAIKAATYLKEHSIEQA